MSCIIGVVIVLYLYCAVWGNMHASVVFVVEIIYSRRHYSIVV